MDDYGIGQGTVVGPTDPGATTGSRRGWIDTDLLIQDKPGKKMTHDRARYYLELPWVQRDLQNTFPNNDFSYGRRWRTVYRVEHKISDRAPWKPWTVWFSTKEQARKSMESYAGRSRYDRSKFRVKKKYRRVFIVLRRPRTTTSSIVGQFPGQAIN